MSLRLSTKNVPLEFETKRVPIPREACDWTSMARECVVLSTIVYEFSTSFELLPCGKCALAQVLASTVT